MSTPLSDSPLTSIRLNGLYKNACLNWTNLFYCFQIPVFMFSVISELFWTKSDGFLVKNKYTKFLLANYDESQWQIAYQCNYVSH